MNYLFIILSSIISLGSLKYAFNQRNQKLFLKRKYSPIKDIDQYVIQEKENLNKERLDSENYIKEENLELENQRLIFESSMSEEREKLEREKINFEREILDFESAIDNLRDQEKESLEKLKAANNRLNLVKESEESLLLDCGYYEPNYTFQHDDNWKKMLNTIKSRQKSLLKRLPEYFFTKQPNENYGGIFLKNLILAFDAVELEEKYLGGRWFKNGNHKDRLKNGENFQLQFLKLMLRAFNAESDALISKVTWKNLELQTKRIEASFDSINEIGSKYHFCSISTFYKKLKIEELQCVYEYEEWKQKEKEEQRRIREQMREEERAQVEIEKAKAQAILEEIRYQKALEKAQSEVEQANEKQKEKLNKEISELMLRISEMEEKKRKLSQAELTKTGHVYIISNIGSFGENIYKIGMTRRLEPMDRVKELGDASVPFPFDVHGMIRTTDAPKLENALHKLFDQRRLNLENNRKEFFNVTIDEIQESLKGISEKLDLRADLQLTMIAEAKQFRQSQAKREMLQRIYDSKARNDGIDQKE